MGEYTRYRLEDAVGVYPSILRYRLPLDDGWLRRVERDVSRSKVAGKRIGTEETPEAAAKIEQQDERDDAWTSPDDLKPLHDVCTKWCTRMYFPNATARINMVANVIRLYERLRAVTDLRFRIVFKGGVMIRLVLMECMDCLPLRSRETVLSYLDQHKALSISDFDFEIVSDTHDPSPDLVHRFFALDYAVLLWLQREMQKEMSRPPKTPKLLTLDWNPTEQRDDLHRRLQEAIAEFPASHPLHGARVDHVVLSDGTAGYDDAHDERRRRALAGHRTRSGRSTAAPRRNVAIFDCEDTKCVMGADDYFAFAGVRDVPSKSGGGRLYATLNTYVGEGAERTRPEQLLGLFHLARIKHAFVLYYTTRSGERRIERLGGEMIDLSQSHGTSRDEMRHALYKHVTTPYRTYPILGVEDVRLHSYSPEGFLYDHVAMIHYTDAEPQKANKMEKRLARYVAFFVSHVLSPDVPGRVECKMEALAACVRAVGAGRAVATGVRPVDAFLAREREPMRASRTYARLLRTTLTRVVTPVLEGMCERLCGEFRHRTLDLKQLKYMNRFLFDHTTLPRLDKVVREYQVQRVVDYAVHEVLPLAQVTALTELYTPVSELCTSLGAGVPSLSNNSSYEWRVLSILNDNLFGGARHRAILDLKRMQALRSPMQRNAEVDFVWVHTFLTLDVFVPSFDANKWVTAMNRMKGVVSDVFRLESVLPHVRDTVRARAFPGTHVSNPVVVVEKAEDGDYWVVALQSNIRVPHPRKTFRPVLEYIKLFVQVGRSSLHTQMRVTSKVHVRAPSAAGMIRWASPPMNLPELSTFVAIARLANEPRVVELLASALEDRYDPQDMDAVDRLSRTIERFLGHPTATRACILCEYITPLMLE